MVLIDLTTKPCPFCAETIQSAAVKCRFCGEFLNTAKARALQEKTDNPENIKVFQILCQEEAKHKQFFETLYDDYMAEQGD